MPNAPSRKKIVAPYSPCLMTSALGPRASTFCAARGKLVSPPNAFASVSLISSTSTTLRVSSNSQGAVDPVIHGIAPGQGRTLHVPAYRRLQIGMDVGQEQKL